MFLSTDILKKWCESFEQYQTPMQQKYAV